MPQKNSASASIASQPLHPGPSSNGCSLTGHWLHHDYSGMPIDAMYRYTALVDANRRPYIPDMVPGCLDSLARINDIPPR